ncbi:MAG: HAD hydrolase family protein, partial [Aquabacterium sp.]|nr:HAD hydrolase family protein [Ferruginibacter sp.]
LQVKISGHIWLDLSHKLANKGRAINVLQQKFNISPNETMVFGDYLNDLEMMQQASFSYAMENAHEDIKNAARFITKSNEEDGVTIVLQELLNAVSI